jgi:hypothetical protein
MVRKVRVVRENNDATSNALEENEQRNGENSNFEVNTALITYLRT